MTAGRALPPVHLGWQVVDPGDPPLSRLIDAVPDTPDPAVQAAWRQSVEAENAQLQRRHADQPVWFPVMRPRSECFVPFFGGKLTTWRFALATLTAALVRGGYARVRVVDLTGSNALETLHALSRHPSTPWGTEMAVVSPRGSTTDVLRFADVDELTTVLADTVVAGEAAAAGFDAGDAKQALLRVGRALAPPVTVSRLQAAVHTVLTNVASAGAFSRQEETELRRLSGEVARRAGLQQDLDRLERSLGSLARFESAATPARRVGRGRVQVKTMEIEQSGSTHEFRIAQHILAHFLYRGFQRPGRPGQPEALVLAGADALPAHILKGLIAAAHRHDKQLVALFEHLDDDTEPFLGGTGSKLAVFFALPNADEAERAAKYLGREFKFVVNGRSVSESRSSQWSTTATTGFDENTSRALSFGQNFGRTLTRGSSRSTSQADQRGGGEDRTDSTSEARVQEYVMQPEQFQQLPDTAMLILDDKLATLAHCDPSIRARRTTSAHPYQLRRG